MFYHVRMIDQCIPTAEAWLLENTKLGSRQRKAMSRLCPVLMDALPATTKRTSPVVISIAGAPGSGKSTLALMLSAVLVKTGRRCQLLSLDDYYLPLSERRILADRVHPLCVVRGVPGTHDLPLLLNHLERLSHGNISDLAMPQFDKARDDRKRSARHYQFDLPPEYILLEGWVCGAPPQPGKLLTAPINRLEARQDKQQIWRRWANRNLLAYQRATDQWLDSRWYLRAPDWDSVIDWRWQQEKELPIRALKSRTAVEDFLAHYQRLVEHLQLTPNDWADLVIPLDSSHCATISTHLNISGKTG